VAQVYLQAGYQVFILRYSVKEHAKWPNPLKDYEQAMGLIRSKADEWHIYPDKIAVVGFSAGGHLAASAAAMSVPEARPNAAILGYPVTEADTVAWCEATAPDAVAAVDKDTCPCFIFHARDDGLVPMSNTLSFLNALDKANISYEAHIYAFGGHGYSLGTPALGVFDICSRAPRWIFDSIEWLKDIMGDFGPDGLTSPKCAPTFVYKRPF
jgi:acetyl esterase/lipase